MRNERRAPRLVRDRMLVHARENRREMPLAQRLLWSRLCGDQIHGMRFRRGHPLLSPLPEYRERE